MSGTYDLDVFYQIHLLLYVFQFGKVCQMNTYFVQDTEQLETIL